MLRHFSVTVIYILTGLALTEILAAQITEDEIPVRIQEVKIDTNEDLIPDLLGVTVTVTGRVTVGSGTLDSLSRKVSIQDGSAGLILNDSTLSMSFGLGDSVIVTGRIGQYQGLTQLDVIQFRIIPTKALEPTPVNLNATDMTFESLEGQLVYLQGRVHDLGHSLNGDQFLAVHILNKRAKMINIFVYHNQNPPIPLSSYNVDDLVEVTGILGQYDTSAPYDAEYEIYPRFSSDISRKGYSNVFYRRILFISGTVALGIFIWVIVLRTELRRQARQLEDREERLSNVIDNIDEIVYGVNFREDPRHGNLQFVSRQVENIIGYTNKDFLKDPDLWARLIHPDDLPVLEKFTQQMIKSKKTATRLYRVKNKLNGEYRWVEDKVVPRFDNEGRFIGQFGVARDVTDRIRDENELREQHALLIAQQESSTDGILVIDPKGKVISHNQRFLDLWDLPKDLAGSGSDVAMLDHVMDQLKEPDEFRAKVDYLYQHPDEESLGDRIHFKDGRIVSRNSVPVKDDQGQILGRMWQFRDVTESQRQKEDISRLLELEKARLSQIHGVIDVAGQIRLATPLKTILQNIAQVISETLDWHTVVVCRTDADYTTSEIVTGVGISQDELENMRRMSVETAGTRPGFRDQFMHPEFLVSKSYFIPEEAGGAERLNQANVRAGDSNSYTGEWRQGDFLVVPIQNRKGGGLGIITVDQPTNGKRPSQDNIKLLELFADQAAIAISNAALFDQVKYSEAMKELLLDVITHDLKNPAGVISGMADIMQMEDPDREEIQLIKESSENLLRVVENAAILSRVSIGDEIDMQQLDLVEVVKHVEEEYSSIIKEAGMTLEIDLPEGLKVVANPIIDQIIKNYFSNAVKYSSDGKKIIVEAESNKDSITVFVKDYGRTIPQKERQAIFERGIRLDKSGKRGQGLGLAIAKRIAEAHAGEVGVTSIKPRGNSFYIRLPRA